MWFAQRNFNDACGWCNRQLTAIKDIAKDGFDIDIKPHRKKRTIQQNKFLFVILEEIVKFHHNTGYVVPGLCAHVMCKDVLKVYWTGRFGVESTKNMSAADFGKLCDFIQQNMVQETNGAWEILDPESDYVKALIEQGGV